MRFFGVHSVDPGPNTRLEAARTQVLAAFLRAHGLGASTLAGAGAPGVLRGQLPIAGPLRRGSGWAARRPSS